MLGSSVLQLDLLVFTSQNFPQALKGNSAIILKDIFL